MSEYLYALSLAVAWIVALGGSVGGLLVGWVGMCILPDDGFVGTEAKRLGAAVATLLVLSVLAWPYLYVEGVL